MCRLLNAKSGADGPHGGCVWDDFSRLGGYGEAEINLNIWMQQFKLSTVSASAAPLFQNSHWFKKVETVVYLIFEHRPADVGVTRRF